MASKDKILTAALKLAEDYGWNAVTLADIAEKADLTLADVHDHFEDRFDILSYLGRTIDHKVLTAIPDYGEDESPRDKLFDILMNRFDALNEHRTGIMAILNSFRSDPKQAVISLPHLGQSMTWMLEAAGIGTTGLKGAVRVAGLSGLYLKTLWVWRDDDSPDMAKTMAALDKNLSWAEKMATTLGLSSTASKPSPVSSSME